MANKASTTKSASKSAAPKTPKQTKPKSEPVVPVQDTSTVQVEDTSSPIVEPPVQQVWRASDHLTERVPVRSAIYGTLIYVDSLTHRKWVWTEFGQRHEIALEVLENARNTQPSFLTSKLPVTQKVQLARRAQELINEGKLDSVKAVRALEKTLGVNFEM